MRVALVSYSVASEVQGGSEAYVSAFAPALAARHDTVLLTAARTPVPGVETIQVPGLPHLTRDAPAGRKLVWHVRDQWLPGVHAALVRELRRLRPDVVHTHQPQGLSAAVFTAVARTGLPHVHTTHDVNVLCMRMTMTREGHFCGGRCLSCVPQRQIRKRALARHLDRLIAPSDWCRELHVAAGVVAPERAVTIRQAADDAPHRQREPGDGAPVFGFIGALAPHKGVPALLEAFRSSADGAGRLELAGGGPLEALVRSEASRDGRVRYAGVVTGAAKDDFYEGIDVLVIPSEVQENAPLVAAEAAARGIPAIVSDRGGLPETPEAVVVRAGDARALAAAMRDLAGSPQRIVDASRRLLERREDFLWPAHVRRVEAVLRSAVANGRDRGPPL